VGLSDAHSLLLDELPYLTEAAATTIYHMTGITLLLEICDIRELNYTVKLMDSIFNKFCAYSVNFFDAHVEIRLCYQTGMIPNTLFVLFFLPVLPVLAKKAYIHSNLLGSFQSKIQSSHLLYAVKYHHTYFTYNVTILVFIATIFMACIGFLLPSPHDFQLNFVTLKRHHQVHY